MVRPVGSIQKKEFNNVKHPESYNGVPFFCQLNAALTRNKDPVTLECIIAEITNTKVIFLNLSSKHCTEEYKKKLAEWDMVTPLKIWCGMNAVPCERFTCIVGKTHINYLIGDYHVPPNITSDIKKKRRKTRKRSINDNTVNKIFNFETGGYDIVRKQIIKEKIYVNGYYHKTIWTIHENISD